MDVAELRAMALARAPTVYNGNLIDVDVRDGMIAFKVSPFDKERARLVPNSRYIRKTDEHVAPLTRAQLAALSGVFDGRINPTKEAQLAAANLFSTHVSVPFDYHPDLYPFQPAGVDFLIKAGSSLFSPDMGVGKTIMAIEYLRYLHTKFGGPSLVVAPLSMVYKWESEIRKWYPEADPVPIIGTPKKKREAIATIGDNTIAIINYDGLRSHSCMMHEPGGKALEAKYKVPKELNEFKWALVVADEVHNIKDKNSLKTRALKQMGSQARYTVGMTGTPVVNGGDDIHSIMKYVAPDEYGSLTQFRNRYGDMQMNYAQGREVNMGLRKETRDEFDSFFLPRFYRVTKEEVLPDLPEKMPIDYRVIPLTPKQRTLYNKVAKGMMAWIGDNLLSTENTLDQRTRLLQIASAMVVVDELGKVTSLDKPSNKLNALVDILDEAPGEPLVVYAESRKLVELFQRELESKYRIGMITGAIGPALRTRYVEAFQNGELDIIMGTIGAGATGLTLTAANRVVIAQQSASWAANAQVVDRVHRNGQARKVQPIVLLSKGTYDLGVLAINNAKEGQHKDLVRDPAWLKAAIKGEV